MIAESSLPCSQKLDIHLYLIFWGPCIVVHKYNGSQQDALFLYFTCSNIYPTRCNVTQFIYIWNLLYMFRVAPPPIIRSVYKCIYWAVRHLGRSEFSRRTGRVYEGSIFPPLLFLQWKGPSLTLRWLMSYIYIYGATILDVSRSHKTTQHSR